MGELDKAENLIDKAAVAAQMGVLAVIMRRLGDIKRGDTPADLADLEAGDWVQIERALKRGRALILQAVSKAAQIGEAANREWAAPYYEASGAAESAEASEAMRRGREAMGDAADRLCRTSVLCLIDEKGRPTALREAYTDAVGSAVAAMRAGEASYQTAIAKAASELARDGLRVRYASGYTRELYASVRTNVMDAYKAAMMEQRRAHSEAFGADAVEVSAHWPCAPDHQPYQGQRYPLSEWKAKQSEPGRPLVTGPNCRHTVSFVIMGVGKPPYTSEELERMERESNEVVRFRGIGGRDLSMTRYEATQYQRGVEREIRRSRAEGYLLEQAGRDGAASVARAEDYAAYYRSFCDRLGLSRRDERTRLYV